MNNKMAIRINAMAQWATDEFGTLFIVTWIRILNDGDLITRVDDFFVSEISEKNFNFTIRFNRLNHLNMHYLE